MYSFLRTDRQPFRNRAPNSFVSIRITSAEIKHNVSTVQEDMIKMMPEMEDIIQNPSKLHITLMVLSLQTDEDIEMCVPTNIHAINLTFPTHLLSIKLDRVIRVYTLLTTFNVAGGILHNAASL